MELGKELYEKPAYVAIKNHSDHKPKEEFLNEASFTFEVEVNPRLVAMLDAHGFTRRGVATWSIHNSEAQVQNFETFLHAYARTFTPRTLVASARADALSLSDFSQSPTHPQPRALCRGTELNRTNKIAPAVERLLSRDDMTLDVWSRDLVRNLGTQLLNLRVKPEFATVMEQVWGAAYAQGRRYYYHGPVAEVPAGAEREVLDSALRELTPFVLTIEAKENYVYLRLRYATALQNLGYYEKSLFDNYRNDQYQLDFDDISEPEFFGAFQADSTGAKPRRYYTYGEVAYYTRALAFHYTPSVFTPAARQALSDLSALAPSDAVLVKSVAGDPTKASLVPFTPVTTKINTGLGSRNIVLKGNTSVTDADRTITMTKLADVQAANPDRAFLVHPALYDVKAMAEAKPYDGEDRLYRYQRRAVGLQLATEKGFVNALDTGIGKSIVQLTAMRERSRTRPNYRGLIVCQSNTVRQWKEYLLEDNWFPEARVEIINSGSQSKKLIEGLAHEGPLVLITTFNMVGNLADLLDTREAYEEKFQTASVEDLPGLVAELQEAIDPRSVSAILSSTYWNDICADEAMAIRNGSASKQSQGLWHLREQSEVATALTATPFNKDIDDIVRLLSWVRNDRRLFFGNRLSSQYDQKDLTAKDAKKIFDSLNPLVFRFTKEEAQAEEASIEIPEELAPETVLLTPSPAERALAKACEYELKRIVQELETALNAFDAVTPEEKEALEEAREELKAAHGQWMTGTMLARMATGNPGSILKSKSTAAQLVIGQGLVAAAMQDSPTKQRVLTERVLKHVQEQDQILVFTDFVDVANSIAEVLNANGVRAAVFGGGDHKKRDAARVAFQRGDLDVLVCTKAAERGLTLHRASVVYHYDLSWTLEPLLQKAGRAVRVGSKNKAVRTYFLVLEGTIEEKVIEKVFTQGLMSSLVLDQSRGVAIGKTTTGKLMGGLMQASTNLNSRRGALEFGKMLLGDDKAKAKAKR